MSSLNGEPLTECDLASRTGVLEVRTLLSEDVLALSGVDLLAVRAMVGEMPTPGVWTPVGVVLPEEDQDVLVATPCGVAVGWWTPGGWTILGPTGDDTDVVTHWQPLPAGPRVELVAGRYRAPDGQEGLVHGYDLLACCYTFTPDGWTPPPFIGGGWPDGRVRFGLDVAHLYTRIGGLPSSGV